MTQYTIRIYKVARKSGDFLGTIIFIFHSDVEPDDGGEVTYVSLYNDIVFKAGSIPAVGNKLRRYYGEVVVSLKAAIHHDDPNWRI